MSVRRKRDEYGNSVYFDTEQLGEGIMDTLSSIGSKIIGKTSKKLASIAAEKLIEKGSEKVGTKLGEIAADKIADKFKKKQPQITSETKGSEIIELLKKIDDKGEPKNDHKYEKLTRDFNDLIN